jgi:hypothetical protein
LTALPHHPDGFKVSEEHQQYFETRTVSKDPSGYARIFENGKTVYVHHIVWELSGKPRIKTENGECLDHKNRNKLDNRIDNLRLASTRRSDILPLNSENRVKQQNGRTSIYKGVHMSKGGWEVSITVKGAETRKRFKTEREAAIAAFNIYEEANRLHGCIFSGHIHPDSIDQS